MTSQPNRSSGFFALFGLGLPAQSYKPLICGCVQSAATLPFSSASTRFGAFKVKSSIPSAMAPSISASNAVMSFWRLRYTMLTFSALQRIAVLAQSIATFPPPTTTTLFPLKSGYLP